MKTIICKQCSKSISVREKDKRMFCDRHCFTLYRRGKFKPYKTVPPPIEGANTTCTGTISEFVVSNDLLAKGYYIFRAVSASAPFDLVAYKDGKTIKIEVKTARVNRNTGNASYTNHVSGEQDIVAYSLIDEGTIIYMDKNKKTIQL